MKKRNLILLGIAVTAIILILIIKIINKDDEKLVIRAHSVAEYTVENTVTATGTIEPVEQVEVGTQVSGEIAEIYVDFNSIVKKGQIIAELDKSTLIEKVQQAEANVRSAESELNYAQTNYNRTKQLYESNAATKVAYDEAHNSLIKAETSLLNAKSNLGQANVNLGYAEIYSPIDGVVLSREVEVGQTVAASYSTPTLFTIANDLTQMKVEADVDEADIGRVKEGQQVVFTVDAYIEDNFKGIVEQIRLQPTTTNNVVTYTVVITAPNPEQKLLPGMTASVTIITEQEIGLAIPSEALSFMPSEEVLAEIGVEMKKGEMPPKREMPKNAPKPDMKMPPMPPNGEMPPMPPSGFNKNNGNFMPEDMGMVWVKKDGKIRPQPIKTGMSDGVYKIVEQGLNAGDSIVLSAEYVTISKQPKRNGSSPFMPGPPKRGPEQNSNNRGRSSQK